MGFMINSYYLVPLLALFIYVNYKRTNEEEEFLLNVYKEEAVEYFQRTPRFNIIRGIFLKAFKFQKI